MIPKFYSNLLQHILQHNLPLPFGCSKSTCQDILLLNIYLYGIDSNGKFVYLAKDGNLVEIVKEDVYE